MSVKEAQRRIDYQIAEFGVEERYAGSAWWQLSPEEAQVFDLWLSEMPLLIAVHSLFYDAIDLTSCHPKELVVSLRAECPWLTMGILSLEEWQRFASLFGISRRKSHASYDKHHWHDCREGVVSYEDE